MSEKIAPTGPNDAEIEDRFRNHPPSDEARRRHLEVAAKCAQLAKDIRDLTPFSREQSLALTAAEECSMWANKAIARNHDKLTGGA